MTRDDEMREKINWLRRMADRALKLGLHKTSASLDADADELCQRHLAERAKGGER